MANYGGYDSGAEDAGLSAADQDPGTAGGDTSEDGAVSEMYSNFAVNFNNQAKANGTNPGTKGGTESALAPITTTKNISPKAISNPNTRDIDFQSRLTAQQSRQAANVKSIYSQLQTTEEKQADFKSGRSVMDKAAGYAKDYFSDPLAPGKHVADFGVRNVKGFEDRTDMSDREVSAFEVAMAIPTNLFSLPFTALSLDKMSKKQGRGGPNARDFSSENPYGTAGAYGISKEARGIAGPTAPEGAPSEAFKPAAIKRTALPTTPNSTSLAISPARKKSTMSAGNVYRRGNRGTFYV